ncbi:hypothetical protein FO519_002560 [Halicephalobus sp. NKZ332]|nr:hypothetical protein FO519_002560 [Halicephalobus sp. NKZ332]
MVGKKKLRKCIRLLETDNLGLKYINEPTELEEFGTIKNFLSFREKSYTLISYETSDQARSAQAFLDERPLIPNGHKICVFFVDSFPQVASREVQLPNGLILNEEFVTEEEESSLMKFLNTLEFETLNSRLVKHFGYRFDYGKNTAFELTDPMPREFDQFIEKIKLFFDEPPDQCTVNFYKPGNGISPHVDNHSGFCETIAVISLSSSVNMNFHHMANSSCETELFVPRRSLMVMKGESRYCYKHMIRSGSIDVNPVNGQVYKRSDRYSLTFRKITCSPCRCPFPEYCNSDRGEYNSLPKTNEEAEIVEKLYVQKTYEGIADDFDTTRYSKWKSIVDFLNTIPKGGVVLDAGCGNGKYLSREPHHYMIGFDMCQNLLKAATKRGEVFHSSLFEIPIRNESVDAIICVAVIHHFATPERRHQAIVELARILVPGGRACVTVWSFEQKDSVYAQMRSGRPKAVNPSRENGNLPIHDGTVFTSKDMLVPWLHRDHQQPSAFRYYHLFDEGELDSIVGSISGLKVVSSEYEEGNYVVIFEKGKTPKPQKATGDRAQLLGEIHRGTKLKKAVTNDRSALQVAGSASKPSAAPSGGNSHSSVASTSTSSGQAPAAPAGLAGLFANGVPKKPSDAKKMGSGTLKPTVPTSSIPPPKPVNSMSLRNDGQTTHFPSIPNHPVTTTSSAPQAKQKPPPPEAPPAVSKPQKWNTMRPAVPSAPKPPQLKRTESIEENSNTSRNTIRSRPAAPPPPPPSARPAMNTLAGDDLPPPPPPPRHASVESNQPPPPPNFGPHKNNNNTWSRQTAQPVNVPTYNSPSSSSTLGTSPILAGSHMRAIDAPFPPSTPRSAVKSAGKTFEERFRFLSVDQLPPPETFAVGKHAAV